MKTLIFLIVVVLIPVFQINKLEWVIEPKYDEIIVYGKNSFVAKEGEIYKVLDYNEKSLYEFDDEEILRISEHPNEGGELQEIINIRYHGNKSRLFNIASLKFLHEDKFYLLQTDYYQPERKLIRVFDELKEGVMDYEGNMIFPPIYREVIVEKEFKIGFKEDEILLFNNENDILHKLQYQYDGAEFIKKRKLFKVQKQDRGEPNIYKEKRVYEEGVYKVKYELSEEKKMVSGIVDINNKEIIPFIYSSIYVKSDDYLEVTIDAKITKKGFAISFFNPKVGLVDFTNKEIIPIEYKHIDVIEGGYVQVEDFNNKRAVFNLEKQEFETGFIYDTYNQADAKIVELDSTIELIEFKQDGLIGLKNRNGDVLIPAKYSGIDPTMNPDIYIIYGASDDEYGYQGYYNIALKKEIVPTLFADRGGIGGYKMNSQNDVISVMDPETSKIGYYKIDGSLISEPKYEDYVDGFSEDLAPVFGDFSDKTGMIDIIGNLVYDYIFDSMTLPYDGKSIVSYKGKFGILKLR